MANENLINKGKNELTDIIKEIKQLKAEFHQFKKTLDEVLEGVKTIIRDM